MLRFPVVLAALASIGVAQAPPAASVNVEVQVPLSMRSAPFNTTRLLMVPPNFAISVYARIPGARFMAVTPSADLLVSVPWSGLIYLVRPNASGDPIISVFASGLRNPHDMVFATIAGISYLYVAESNQITRFVYKAGNTVAAGGQTVITGLPDASSPELKGAYGHQLKNIAIGSDGKLYVSIASTSNASVTDAVSDPVRCSIYQYNSDGTSRRLFAKGLRNAEGLAFIPGTSILWATVNSRDNVPVPAHTDADGNGTDDYGKVIPAYVDNHPPDLFTRVADGGNYGWPYANPDPDTPTGLTNMPFNPDYDNNRDWTQFPKSTFTPASKGIQAHSAPLGFSFLQDSGVPQAYRNGAVVALHGSWNRRAPTGYKVIYFPWQADGLPGTQMDLVRGWLDANTQTAWGRPVDVIPDLANNLLISDDTSGTIYKLTPTSAPKIAPVVTLTAPITGATYTAPAVINMAATASDSDGYITRVEFWQGPNKLGEKYGPPYTWTIYGAPAGVYSGQWALRAEAFDNSGAAATSNAVAVTVLAPSNKSPVVKITSPANGAVLPQNFTITADVYDPGPPIVRVEFWQGPNKLGVKYTAPYVFNVYGATPMAYTGQWGLTVKAFDSNGAVTTSGSIDFTVTK